MMNNQFFSLLYMNPKSKESEYVISGDIIDHIGFNDVKNVFKNTERHFDKHKSQLQKCLTDEESILYRQELLTDFVNCCELRDDISKILSKINGLLREYNEYATYQRDRVRDVLWKTELLGMYIECIEELYDILNRHKSKYKSKGLILLLERLVSIKGTSMYQYAKSALPIVKEKIDGISSITIDVHFNTDYKPIIATMSKSESQSPESLSIAETLFGVKDYKKRQTFSVFSHSLSGLKTIYDQTFKQNLEQLAIDADPILKAYNEEDLLFLCELDYEFDFYLAAVKFMTFWDKQKVNMCLPSVLLSTENICEANDVIDLGLAIRMLRNNEDLKKLVSNGIELNDQGRIYVLTGANRGGKTTYLRSVGITYILFQNGLYISGCYAKMSPVKGIFAHFPKEQTGLGDQGHLSEELAELKRIVEKTNKGDLILLNESLSGTSMTDSLIICTDYLKILSEIGVKCLFATHLHLLAEQCDKVNQGKSVISKVDSLVAMVEEEVVNGEKKRKRTYKIERRKADGESYADEIARGHGLSYRQILSGRQPTQVTYSESSSFSLLHTNSYTKMEFSDRALHDIGFDKLTHLLSDFSIDYGTWMQRLTQVPADKVNISYRQEIFQEIILNQGFADEVRQFIDEAAELEKRMVDKYHQLPDHRRKLRWKIHTLKQYVHCVDSLYTLLQKNECKSEGFIKLQDLIKEFRNRAEHIALTKLLPNMEKEVRNMRNVQIRMKFDSKLQPDKLELKNIGYLKLSAKEVTNPSSEFKTVKITAPGQELTGKLKSFMRRLYSALIEEKWITRIVSFKPAVKGNMELVLLNEMHGYVNECLKRLEEGMDSYLAEHGGWMIRIASELDFYSTGYRLVHSLMKWGIPMCKPTLSEENIHEIQGLCDISTGLNLFHLGKSRELVPNDLDFSLPKKVFILTGPNQGGKTTFLRGIGIAQLFFQGGLYVPAIKAQMSPVNKLWTHFIRDESKLIGEGRLGEELKDLSDIVYSISKNDLLLMDESISCTAAYDGFIIGKNIIKALCDIGTKVIYSTHLHELSNAVDQMNGELDSKNRIVSLITTGIENISPEGELHYVRTYKVTEGRSDGKSHAADIAEQHGMTYSKMKENIKSL